ncbi:MAG: lamin tail domain-containing protein, partial [Patescibacteria group bacterium]
MNKKNKNWQWTEPTPGNINNELETNNELEIANQKENQEKIIPQATSGVVINEFVPNPLLNEKEWIELYNFTDQEIDINGWIIEEGAGSKTVL